MAGWTGLFCEVVVAPGSSGSSIRNATEGPFLVAMDEDLGAPPAVSFGGINDPAEQAKGPSPQQVATALSASLSAMDEGGATGIDAPLSSPALNASVLDQVTNQSPMVGLRAAAPTAATVPSAPQLVPGALIMPPKAPVAEDVKADEAPLDMDADLLKPGVI